MSKVRIYVVVITKEMMIQKSGLRALPWYEWAISSNYRNKSCSFAADSGLL